MPVFLAHDQLVISGIRISKGEILMSKHIVIATYGWLENENPYTETAPPTISYTSPDEVARYWRCLKEIAKLSRARRQRKIRAAALLAGGVSGLQMSKRGLLGGVLESLKRNNHSTKQLKPKIKKIKVNLIQCQILYG